MIKASIVLFVCGALFLPLTAQESNPSLEGMLKDGDFWQLSRDGFMERYGPLGFRWTSEAKTSARFGGGGKKGLPIGESEAGETIVNFNGEKPNQLQVSIHNRGDDGELSEEKYFETLKLWGGIMNGISGVAGEARKKDNKSAVGAQGQIWNTEKVAYLVEYSSQQRPFRSEFIRLRVAPIVKLSFMEEKLADRPERVSKKDLPSNVVKKDGDVYIEGIPMVDQGQKGYCVVASTARMFGYYNMQVDQHEIAQMANSSAEGGTSTTGMIEALDDIAGKFKVRVKTHDAMEYTDMMALTEDYNRMANREKANPVPAGGNVNQWDNFDRFDPEILKKTRLRSASGIKKFEAEVIRSIDAGIPLLWTVTVGIFEEPKRISQTRGGHMRMIIGYNKAKRQIIFSDSWGAGHEMKHWGIEEAYCSTKGIYSIQPTT